MHILWWIIVGLIAGWATGKIMKGEGYGTLMDIVIGIAGALLGGFIMRTLGFKVFSFMTSFPLCSETSFTLPRERSERGSEPTDAFQNHGRSRTKSAVCGSGDTQREAVSDTMQGVWSFYANRPPVVEALPGPRNRGDCGAKPATASQPA